MMPRWTAEEVDTLREMHGAGQRFSDIAKRLKRTEGSVIGKADRLNLTERDAPERFATAKVVPTEVQIEKILYLLKRRVSIEMTAKMTGATPYQVSNIRTDEDIEFCSGARWAVEDFIPVKTLPELPMIQMDLDLLPVELSAPRVVCESVEPKRTQCCYLHGEHKREYRRCEETITRGSYCADHATRCYLGDGPIGISSMDDIHMRKQAAYGRRRSMMVDGRSMW